MDRNLRPSLPVFPKWTCFAGMWQISPALRVTSGCPSNVKVTDPGCVDEGCLPRLPLCRPCNFSDDMIWDDKLEGGQSNKEVQTPGMYQVDQHVGISDNGLYRV